LGTIVFSLADTYWKDRGSGSWSIDVCLAETHFTIRAPTGPQIQNHQLIVWGLETAVASRKLIS
jgi:hypothetical protein